MTGLAYNKNRKDIVKEKLIEAFAKLSLEKSFLDITIKDITRTSGISTTAFYNYFSSKDDLLKYYVDYSLRSIEKLVDVFIKYRLGLSSMIRGLLHIFTTFGHDEKLLAFHRVFREFEFLKKDLAEFYYTKLLDVLDHVLKFNGIPEDKIDPKTISISIIGSAEFIHLFRRLFNTPGDISADIEVAGDLIMKGLGIKTLPINLQIKDTKDLKELIEEYDIYKLLKIPENKQMIISAALDVLANKSFRDSKIYEFMDKAGYAIGMFYKIYESKEDLLKDLVSIIGKTLRRYLTMCTLEAKDPVEREAMGTACFLSFIKKNGTIYRIVRESEYINIDIAKSYYTAFLRSYSRRIETDMERYRIHIYKPESLAISLMGINHMIGLVGMILKETNIINFIRDLAKIYSNGIIGLQEM